MKKLIKKKKNGLTEGRNKLEERQDERRDIKEEYKEGTKGRKGKQ